jgi:uncharacterized protein YjbI with pentapeptide repeats
MSNRAADDLRADCASCFGLCCVAPAFAASADFAIDKPAGTPCPHLQADFRCSIHVRLRSSGFPGCDVFDCFGAGQQVAQVTFHGRDWRRAPRTAGLMFRTFAAMRDLHELMWYLTEALDVDAARELRTDLAAALESIRRLTGQEAEAIAGLDTEEVRREVDVLLRRTSELARALRPAGPDLRGADLVGRHLEGADLRGADLRGALLIGADLAGADLGGADVIGADFRATDVRGAHLDGSLFLTQFQVNAAKGDVRTTLPPVLARPRHWRE